MRYDIIHIQGNCIEDVTQRMSAVINTYADSGWRIDGKLDIIKVGEDTFSCVKEIIHE